MASRRLDLPAPEAPTMRKPSREISMRWRPWKVPQLCSWRLLARYCWAFSRPSSGEQLKLEAELLENEQQMEAIGSPQSALDTELELLREVLEHPGRYVRIEQKRLRLSTMNVVLEASSTDVASDIAFSIAQLTGVPRLQSAFVLARFARSELPPARMNFEVAERYL